MGVFLLLAVLLPATARAQEPATGETPPAPAQPPPPAPGPAPAPAPTPEPVPVIPPRQPIGPPPTVPSAPERTLPAPGAGVPVTATFQLVPTLTLSEEYSDNFNLSARDKQSNFRSSVSPGLRLLINSAFTRGTVAYNFSPTHDTATGELSYFHSLLGQVQWQATPRWTLTVADALTRSDQPNEADALGLRQERRTFTSNRLSLDSDYLIGTIATRQSYRMSIFANDQGSETTSHVLAVNATAPLYQTNSVSAGYEYLLSNAENGGSSIATGTGEILTTANAAEIRGHRVTAAARRQLTSRSAAGLSTSYALRTVTSDAGDSDFQLWTASLFTTYTLSSRLTINSSLGLNGLITDSGQSRAPGFTSATSVSYQFARAVLSLTVNRGFSETFAEGENQGVVETDSVTASLSYPFTPLLFGRATAFYRSNTATSTVDASGGRRDGGTENWGGTLALSLQLLRNVSFGLDYSFLRQEGAGIGRVSSGTTQPADTGYTENRIRASVGVSF